jgi:propionyl-CoA carboxylase alpha chain
MISKLITHGKTRQESIDRMIKALDKYVIVGVKNNISLLRDILENKNYTSGKLTTDYLKDNYPEGFKGIFFIFKKKKVYLI